MSDQNSANVEENKVKKVQNNAMIDQDGTKKKKKKEKRNGRKVRYITSK